MSYVVLLLLYIATLIAVLKSCKLHYCKTTNKGDGEDTRIEDDQKVKETDKECLKNNEDEEEANWDQLARNTCPNCGTKDQLDVFAEAGMSFNALCHKCRVVWWLTPERAFGAKIVGKRD